LTPSNYAFSHVNRPDKKRDGESLFLFLFLFILIRHRQKRIIYHAGSWHSSPKGDCEM